MKFQTLDNNQKTWFLGVEIDSTANSDLSGIIIVLTDTQTYLHFDPLIQLSKFLELNKLSDPIDVDEITQIINALLSIESQLRIVNSNSNPVNLLIPDWENSDVIELKLNDFKLMFPLMASSTSLSLYTLKKINEITLQMANLKSKLLNTFIYEHDEKYQCIIKFVKKLNTKYEPDPFNTAIVKEILDIHGSSVHLNHAKLKSSDIITKSQSNEIKRNEIFTGGESSYWEMIQPIESNLDSSLIKLANTEQPNNIPISNLRCPFKSSN